MSLSVTTLGVKKQNDNACAEAALYPPIKAFLERQGYEVKAEVRGCDLVARRGDEPLIIVELKLRLNLALILQGVDRLALTERVYLAVPRPTPRRRGGVLAPDRREIRKLCRRVGLGLMLVGSKAIQILEEPVPYRPRQSKTRVLCLINEFSRRVGDANVGGGVGVPLVTAYRQDALRCARALADYGPMRVGALRTMAGVPNTARILQHNVYGWFERIERGIYGLTPAGGQALSRFAEAIPAVSQW